jgi:hypothetical protein
MTQQGAMNFLRDDDVDAMDGFICKGMPLCSSRALHPHKLSVEPHIPAVMACYQGIIQHNE